MIKIQEVLIKFKIGRDFLLIFLDVYLITLKMAFLKRPQYVYPSPKNGHFLGEWGKIFVWERFNFELENFYSRETYFGERWGGLAGLPITLIRLALLGHEFQFLPIWGVFIVIFWAQIWSYRTCTAEMTIPSGI